MQKALLFFFLLFLSISTFSQEENEESFSEIEDLIEFSDSPYQEEIVDTLTYNKTIDYYQQRSFDNALKNKYAGKDFEYIDNLKKEEEKEIEVQEQTDSATAELFVSFMANIFPYLLGILVVFIIVKSFVNIESSFWKFGKQNKKAAEKLIYEEEEDIDKNDYEKLLNIALKNKDFRSATRYHYLSLLKKLSYKGLIKYDRDKTNTEYKFELQSEQMRRKFSYLAYIYDYVWYGEFQINEIEFNTIENNYKTFINNLN